MQVVDFSQVNPSYDMNGTGNGKDISAETEPTMYEIVAWDGNTHGPFETMKEAADYARHEWPDQEQDPDRTGSGWDVQEVGS